MNIILATPSLPGGSTGNAITAGRWARLLRELGHRVRVVERYDGARADLLIALHARKSAAAVERFERSHPGKPIVVAMAGTDLYGDLTRGGRARRAVEAATRIVVLQKRGLHALPPAVRRRAVVIEQSVTVPRSRATRRKPCFEVLVLANLRPVKDPLRTALAVRRLPESSRICVTHAGVPLRDGYVERLNGPRYDYIGSVSHAEAMRLVRRARVLCLTSRAEGGANVIGEAIACGTPVIASRIEGSVGLLGSRYPGLFDAGDTAALRALLLRVEREATFRRRLERDCRRLAPLFRPARERRAWQRLLAPLAARQPSDGSSSSSPSSRSARRSSA